MSESEIPDGLPDAEHCPNCSNECEIETQLCWIDGESVERSSVFCSNPYCGYSTGTYHTPEQALQAHNALVATKRRIDAIAALGIAAVDVSADDLSELRLVSWVRPHRPGEECMLWRGGRAVHVCDGKTSVYPEDSIVHKLAVKLVETMIHAGQTEYLRSVLSSGAHALRLENYDKRPSPGTGN